MNCRIASPLVAGLLLASACHRKEEPAPPPAEVAEAPPPPPPAPVDETAGIEAEITGLKLGERAPKQDVPLLSVDGKEVTIGGLAGAKGRLVVFTCNHCPYASAWEKRIVALGNDYQGRGIGVIAINANDPAAFPEDGYDEMKRRAAARGMRYPYVVDRTSEVARAFGADRTPEAFLFDADGKLVYHGTIDDNAQDEAQVTQRYLADALAATVSGQKIPVAETKSLGCTIKYRPSA